MAGKSNLKIKTDVQMDRNKHCIRDKHCKDNTNGKGTVKVKRQTRPTMLKKPAIRTSFAKGRKQPYAISEDLRLPVESEPNNVPQPLIMRHVAKFPMKHPSVVVNDSLVISSTPWPCKICGKDYEGLGEFTVWRLGDEGATSPFDTATRICGTCFDKKAAKQQA